MIDSPSDNKLQGIISVYFSPSVIDSSPRPGRKEFYQTGSVSQCREKVKKTRRHQKLSFSRQFCCAAVFLAQRPPVETKFNCRSDSPDDRLLTIRTKDAGVRQHFLSHREINLFGRKQIRATPLNQSGFISKTTRQSIINICFVSRCRSVS